MDIARDDPRAAEFTLAVWGGDVAGVRDMLARQPELATARFLGRQPGAGRTPLHVVTDWPGYFPRGPEMVRILVAGGADPNDNGGGDETPLHWAASSDDVDVAAALIDVGADIHVPGGSIGTPLANAVGYGCWHVAHLLVARGARVEAPWQAAALGDLTRLEELVAGPPAAGPGRISQAFWHACAAGRRRAAEFLLEHGADLNWVPEYAQGTPLDAARLPGAQRSNVISWLEARGARSAGPSG